MAWVNVIRGLTLFARRKLINDSNNNHTPNSWRCDTFLIMTDNTSSDTSLMHTTGRTGGDGLPVVTSDTMRSSSFVSEIKALLPVDNPIFSGGFGLAVLGIGTQILRKGSGIAMQMARKNLLVTLEVTSKDKSYPWVLQWLTMQGTRTQHLSVETTLQSSQAGVSTSFGFVPSPGFHLLRFRNRFLGVERMREQQMMDLNTGKPWEKVQFIGIGRDTSIFEHILRESYEMASAKEEGKTIIYTNWGTEWRPFGQPRSRRQLGEQQKKYNYVARTRCVF